MCILYVLLDVSGAIIFYGSVRSCNGQCIIQAVFFEAGIVGIVIHLFIADLLYGKILGGVDAQSAAVYGVVCLGFGIAKLCLQVFHDLFDQGVYKIAVGSICCLGGIDRLDPGVNIIGHGFVISRLLDVALVQHIAQHFFPPLAVFLGIGHRVVAGRVLCDAGNDRAFGKGQLGAVFSKVTLGSRLHAQSALA